MTLIERLGKYTALGATSIVFEETNPILGGIAARHGRANLLAVIIVVAVGTWLASLALYYLGYWKIAWVRKRWPSKEPLIDRALGLVQRHPWRASLAVRFAYALRLPVPLACGAARVPISLYATATAISCIVWATLFAYIGQIFGGAALAALRYTERLEVRLALGALILIAILVYLIKRRYANASTTTTSPGQ